MKKRILTGSVILLAVALFIFYIMFRKKESENIERYGEL